MEFITHHRHGRNVGDLERTASILAGAWLAISGLRQRGASGWLTLGLGAEMLRRGATGRCYAYDVLGLSTIPKPPGASLSYTAGVRVDAAVTVYRPREEVFRFFRDFRNLPQIMRHLESVTMLDDRRSHWVAKAPVGQTVEWDAEIINEIDNRLIAWRSLPGASVDNAGSVHFKEDPNRRGTIVKVELQYNPPAGMLGALVARMFGEEPTQQIREDLYRLKQVLEAGSPQPA